MRPPTEDERAAAPANGVVQRPADDADSGATTLDTQDGRPDVSRVTERGDGATLAHREDAAPPTLARREDAVPPTRAPSSDDLARMATQDARRSVTTSNEAATRTARQMRSGVVGALGAADGRRLAPLQQRDPSRYELLHEHGRGGLGRVMRAHDKELGRDIAIKELLERSSTAELRFFREAMITAALEHPGIVPVHEAGRWDDGTPFYAMKLVSGRPLHELIDAATSMSDRVALVANVIAVVDAIAYAHDHRILHRDLKPANVIVGEFGETVVIDWGLAKVLDEDASDPPPVGAISSGSGSGSGELTEAGGVLGTPAYMAPEQQAGRADERSDVYALGGILFQILTGLPPHSAGATRKAFPRDTPRDLIAIAMHAMAEDPAARYPSARAMADDLRRYVRREPVVAQRYSVIARASLVFARHRMATLVAIIALALLTITLTVSVVAINGQRGAALEARAEAVAQRDGAQLAQAALLLEKDPTSAGALLKRLEVRDPRYALLLSRANASAAERVVSVPGTTRLLRSASSSSVGLVTLTNELLSVDLESGAVRVIDRDVKGAATRRGATWLYARKAAGDGAVRVMTASATAPPLPVMGVGALLGAPTGVLAVSGNRTFALDHDELYELDDRGPTLLRRGVRSVLGGDPFWLLCTTAGELEVYRGDALVRRSRCASNQSAWPMASAGDGYAALLDPATLLLVRGGQALELPVRIAGEYELAMASTGVFALADYSDKTWFVRRGGDTLELGPLHAAQPTSVAADGAWVAWGYGDGVVVVLDTETGATWERRGSSAAATFIALDAARRRLVSVIGDELRVFELTAPAATPVGRLPCTMYNTALAPDGARVALDCDDGAAREWTLATGAVRELHRHRDVAFGVAWLGRGAASKACSGGYDGQVICSESNGTTRTLFAQASRIKTLVASNDGAYLVVATDDGKVTRVDDAGTETLYTHASSPGKVAFSEDGGLLASGAADGTVIVYDLARREIASVRKAHQGAVTSVVWRSRMLFTASIDSTIKRWDARTGDAILLDTATDAGTPRLVHALPTGWLAAVDRRVLRVEDATRAMRLDLDRRIENVAISKDQRYVAVLISDEIVILDRARRGVASLAMPMVRPSYLGFIASTRLAVHGTGGLFTVNAESLEYVAF